MGQTTTAGNEESHPRGRAPSAPRALGSGAPRVLPKPRFRGWIHVYSAGAAVFAGASLVAVSWAVASTRAGLATLVYTMATIVMFTVSATYHRVRWPSAAAKKWLRRADT